MITPSRPRISSILINCPSDSWLIPKYYIVDLHAGYGFKVKGARMDLRFSLLNALNAIYISDAQNNDQYTTQSDGGFDATSAAVFIGPPRRYNLSLKITI